jgi:hypothetical protein
MLKLPPKIPPLGTDPEIGYHLARSLTLPDLHHHRKEPHGKCCSVACSRGWQTNGSLTSRCELEHYIAASHAQFNMSDVAATQSRTRQAWHSTHSSH